MSARETSAPRPVCFMVMPFGKKKVLDPGKGAPGEVDFDSLWEHALAPTIDAAGYSPVRADQDLGGMIILEMLERLTWADLVVADLSIPNANVYYEVGVRHAAREDGCVLIAAEWSKPALDLDQIRALRYPLSESELTDETARPIRELLAPRLAEMARGRSPLWDSVPAYRSQLDGDPPSSFRDFVESLSKFQARVRAIRALPVSARAEKALELMSDVIDSGAQLVPIVALELLYMLRDHADWEKTLQYLEGLPQDLRRQPVFEEQLALATAEVGDPAAAIGLLEQLITHQGNTTERSGILGGRYKRLFRAAEDERERAIYLDQAIEAYEAGRLLDLNDYYCVSNLAQLYRSRGDEGDEQRAVRVAMATVEACERAERLGSGDEWLHATWLGAAFDTRNPDLAAEMLPRVRKEPSIWKLASTIDDLEQRAGQVPERQDRAKFEEYVSRLKSWI